jgi:hypothetical protein
MSVRVFVMSNEPSLGFNALDLDVAPRIGETINVVDVDREGGPIRSRWFEVTSVVHCVQGGVPPSTVIHIEKKS